MSFFDRLKQGLARNRSGWVEQVRRTVTGALRVRGRVDEELLAELEESLLEADVGLAAVEAVLEALRQQASAEGLRSPDQVLSALRALLAEELRRHQQSLATPPEAPGVILLLGVNGSGKTTTAAKLAAQLGGAGQVILGACDTFRAAAGEQLQVWGDRIGVPVIRQEAGSDPAAVAFDTVQAARARGARWAVLDTAGRLQTRSNLMSELAKIHRVVERALGRPADERLLVLDASVGQNGLSQARLFGESVPLTGLAVTKLDGTARGGIVLAITRELALPVKLIGVGEGVDDLQPFDAGTFVDALFGEGSRSGADA
ncbi:signal recognition particle-docking protein FtsY [Limnochorda pilosa]|uniref:Signal recognition particle receptor FtsY n=1 Tax=Limnochorda pilosa TaxID=1555112 RepID=A0A0K2SKC6_LIMPI|nr:signal recognition particle-docking protein FtsY [Limnochorda pilosa]BAS27472.1 cell division protein FtsY [Limnochorda pilosa]